MGRLEGRAEYVATYQAASGTVCYGNCRVSHWWALHDAGGVKWAP